MTEEEKKFEFEKLLQANDYINFREFILFNDCYDLIEKNIFSVIERIRFSPILITEIKKIKNYGRAFENNIINILKKNYSINRIYNIYSVFTENEISIITKQIKEIYEELSLERFMTLKKYLIDNEKADNNLFNFMYEDKDKFVSKLVDANKNLIEDEDKDSIIELLRRLIDEICKHENKSWKNINYLGTGVYSCVFQIGDKIIKLGSKKKFDAKNNKYILKSLIRIDFNKLCKSKLILEVSENVNTKDKISFKDMTLIYKDLIKSGIYYKDVKEDNFGKLIKDNKKYWERDLADNTGIYGTCSEELKAGDYAIFDIDHFYDKDDKEYKGTMGHQLFMYMCDEKEKNFIYFLSTRIYNIDLLIEEMEKGDFYDIVNSKFEEIFSTLHRSIIDVIDMTKIKGYENILNDNIDVISKYYDVELINYVRQTVEEMSPKIR